jgi:hypothetical protein
MADGIQIDIYEAVIVDLESKISTLQATVENLRNIRSIVSQIAQSPMAANGPRATQNIADFGHDAFFGMTVGEAAKKYLKVVKKTVSIPVLVEALMAGGLKSASTNMRENVRSILGRHPDFVRINGEFGLAEWYPGRKAVSKRRGSSPADESVESTQDEPDESSAK